MKWCIPLSWHSCWAVGSRQNSTSSWWCAWWWPLVVVRDGNFIRWRSIAPCLSWRLLGQEYLLHRQTHLSHHLAVIILCGYLGSWDIDWLLDMMIFPDDLLCWCCYILCCQIHSISLSHHLLSGLSFSFLRHTIQFCNQPCPICRCIVRWWWWSWWRRRLLQIANDVIQI